MATIIINKNSIYPIHVTIIHISYATIYLLFYCDNIIIRYAKYRVMTPIIKYNVFIVISAAIKFNCLINNSNNNNNMLS